MTGHGEAQLQGTGLSIVAEVRTVNSRYFKLTVRMGEGYGSLEPRIESVVRKWVRRGTVQVAIRFDRETPATDFQLNRAVLANYFQQVEALRQELQLADAPRLDLLLALPGVVAERDQATDNREADWPLLKQTLEAALDHLDQMRREEGRAMAADLQENCQVISSELAEIRRRTPEVVAAYQSRLTERLDALLAEHGRQIEPADVVREVGIFSERVDISEELVRLDSHVDQFRQMLDQRESNGRKLDFLTQEMFRETNTIGSKANDPQIAQHVVEIKSRIERMREMIQNVE
jgi:uncharacterized protein (TIGR00255 family)